MLLTREQMKYLETNDDQSFKAKIEKMTKDEKDRLKGDDDLYFMAYGKHLISNYKDL